MFEANAEWVSLLAISITLVGFGFWPRLRQRCEAPVSVFAPLNMLTQLSVVLLCAVVVGSPAVGSRVAWWEVAARVEWGPRTLAIVLGGFVLGHGDNLGCIAFEFIPTAVAYPTYSGISLAGGELMNYAIVGSSTPTYLFAGLGFLLLAIALLTAAQAAIETAPEMPDRPSWVRNSADLVDGGAFAGGFATDSDASDSTSTSPGGLDLALLPPDDEHGSIQAARDACAAKAVPPPLNQRSAFGICVATGVLAALWSPLSTFGRRGGRGVHDAYVTALLFQLGQACAIPSVCVLASRATRSGVVAPWRRASGATVRAGMLCGVSVGCGYCGYFYATTLGRLEPTVALGIAASNPLVAIFIDVFVERSFSRAPAKAKALLGACVGSYAAAIAILATRTK